ncbi:MAG: dockerin type I repeat-containing protein [Prevotella sp.]|nr:dockerin type I repeat-containing protein [Prevotella sp.]
MSNNHAVTDITFNDTKSDAVGANGGTTGYDLNSGCGSGTAYIYMHVTTSINVETLTSESKEVMLYNGNVITGTGGKDTHVKIADGAKVTLNGVTITAIPNDVNHRWAGITCLGDAVIILADGTTSFQLAISSKGDVNSDGGLSIGDVSSIVNHVMGNTEGNFVAANADLNGDGAITVTDVTVLVGMILNESQNLNIVVHTGDIPITYKGGGNGATRVKKD